MTISSKQLAPALWLALLIPLSAHADLPGKHPYYLRALSDLRSAYWFIEHRPGDKVVAKEEEDALQEIRDAIADMKKASIDDGKDIHDHPDTDVPPDHSGRLHRGLEMLKQGYADVDHEEDDAAAKGLKLGVLTHINRATHATEKAITDVEQNR